MPPPTVSVPADVVRRAHEAHSSTEAARERMHELDLHLTSLRREREPLPLDTATELILRRLLT